MNPYTQVKTSSSFDYFKCKESLPGSSIWGGTSKTKSQKLWNKPSTMMGMRGPKFGGMGMNDVFKVTLAQEMSSLGMSSQKPMDLSQKGMNLSRKR